jgi:phosphate transport system substrate-binding protein
MSLFAVLSALVLGSYASGAEPVRVVGSSTLYPLAQAVVQRASQQPRGADYSLASTGTIAGIEAFCADAHTPQILNASRRMHEVDMDRCHANGVGDVIEVKIGYDGITLAESRDGPNLSLSARDLYLALAARIPDPRGAAQLVPNPHRTWQQVRAE